MLIGLLVFLSLPPAEPIISGQPLSYWLDELHSDNIEHASADFQKVLPAIDDRCIPWLVNELDWKPSPALRKTEELGRKWFHRYLNIEPRDRRQEAALLLAWFGPRASNAIPALESLSRFRNGDRAELYVDRGTAIAALILIRHDSMEACARKSIDPAEPLYRDYQYAMSRLSTNAANCIPIYVDAIRTATNQGTKILATWTLGLIHSQPEKSLPVLIQMLNDTNDESRGRAIYALSLFGSTAKPTWNNLIPLLNDPSPTVRWHTTNALREIDSTVAQQLGIGPPPLP